ncbi:glycoside hydrolase [Paenibacillus yonginensis]|uniref:Glycoside hydrolase n=1 Tax=Paenibacillus yonginensis TaxID=1462996 RepID=A0A1B1MZU4_9BACL|nr:alpha-amylase family protein [Paenibacillus yonginensis]ANS74697.1 glycoside hydrolase [Paenibacillus yonginensis]
MKHLIFYDPHFPYAGERPTEEIIQVLSAQMTLVDADGLSGALADERTESLIFLHGPYFPKKAWEPLLAFLRRGGGLVLAGGAPFKIPVEGSGKAWKELGGMTAYHQQLLIHEALPVDPSPIERLEGNGDIPLLTGQDNLFKVAPTYGLVLHVSKHRDIPAESGSNGPMDARIYPLLKGISAEGREVAAPAVLMEHTNGDFSGGRWVLINQTLDRAFWTAEGAAALIEWADFCAAGVTEMWLKPTYASYQPGERAGLRLQLQRIRRAGGKTHQPKVPWRFAIELRRADRPETLWSAELRLEAGPGATYEMLTIPLELEPGLYSLTAKGVSAQGERRILRQGFWGWDGELLREGEPLRRGKDYFIKNGSPLPVVGMTYMTSDVSRKFLFLPNPGLWNEDMAAMSKAGINWLRTGLWTAWRQIMFADGHVSEEVLRAIDAFILTAKRWGLEVTFTFFAFTPEAWEGENPYLDPRSLEAQKRFLLAIVQRHKDTTNVNWDFINEPSMFDPKRIFAGPRSSGDNYERAAFRDWLKQRHGEIGRLQDSWNMTADELPDFESIEAPEPEEISFDIENMRLPRKNNRWLDYTLFTMDMHNRWIRELKQALDEIVPDHLVTVGQDEALGRGPRPSPFFYAGEVDYTTVHTWWLNDQLVWDSVFAKAPDKPLLVQETGIMYLELPDNRAKRSEAELRSILERKYAYAFGTGGAGAVQWLWNTNYFMNNVNESNIGALRADGTEKPEADVSYDFGAFMKAAGGLFEERSMEEIAVVFPYSNDFSNRRFACEATAKAARVLAYELKVPFRGLGEYQLESLSDWAPKLIIVPSPHNFSDEALQQLIEHIENNGGTLLFTGPLGLDSYWKSTDRLSRLTGPRRLANVVREEILAVNGQRFKVSFGQKRIGEVSTERVLDSAGPTEAETEKVYAYEAGKGRLIWSPLPVELNERTEPVAALYSQVIAQTGSGGNLRWIKGGDLSGVFGSLQRYKQGYLFTFVSEYGREAEIEVQNLDNGLSYRFVLERERSFLFSTDAAGRLMASYRNLDVTTIF